MEYKLNEESKKILYVTTRLPYPLVGGDKLRMFNNLKQLKQIGYNITLVSLVSDDDDIDGAKNNNEFYDRFIPVKFNKKLAYLNAVKAVFNDRPFIVQYFYSSKMQKVIDDLLQKEHFDIVTGYMIRVLPYFEKHKNQNIIVDIVDAVSMMYERRFKNKKSLFDKLKIGIEFLKVKNYEKKCAKFSKKQVVISDIDKNYLEKNSSDFNISVIENGVDTEYYVPYQCEKKNNICFVGSMQYIPNSEAAMYFATEIFPLIKNEIPDAKFKIIGANPRKELFEATNHIKGIDITGKVDDVREYMKDCKVSVCPVKIAGGVQNKVLEAMSMGMPVVTTVEGSEGIGADENTLRVVKSNEEYAKEVLSLLKDAETVNRIGNESRRFILEKFSWQEVGNGWNCVIKEVLDNEKNRD